MTTQHTHWLMAVTRERAKGDRIGGVLGPSPNDGSMFTRVGIPCYPQGTIFTPTQDGPITRHVPSQPAVAWAVSLAIRGSLAPFIEQFRDALHPTPLIAAGMTPHEIDEHRAVVVVQVGPRDQVAGTLPTFVESLGYVLAP